MKQKHPLAPHSWIGASASLLVMIAAALGIVWHVNRLVTALKAAPPATSVPGAATSDEATDRGVRQRRITEGENP